MPTYTYACKKCNHEFDAFHCMSATPKMKCESCGSVRVERQLGTGSGIIFKGSGFYETDFKEKKGKKPEEKKAKAETKGDKPKAKSGSKPTTKAAK